jgi:hypothetical protein
MANLKDKVSTFCLPAKIYLVLAVIAIIVGFITGATLIFVFVKLVFAVLWTLLLNFLCNSGLTPLSWFLVLLPYVFILLAFIILLTTSVTNKVGQINNGILNGVQTGTTQFNQQVRRNVQPIGPQY